MIPRPPSPTLFPYTTLFRSERLADLGRGNAGLGRGGETLIGQRLGARVDVAVGVFSLDMVGDPLFDKGQRAFGHFMLLFVLSSGHSGAPRSGEPGIHIHGRWL